MNPRLIEEMGNAMGEVYGAVTDRILINLARHFKYISKGGEITGSWDYQVKKLAEVGQVTRETEQIILDSLGGADEALRSVLETAILNSLKDVEKPLRDAAKKGLLYGSGFLPPELSANQTQAFQAYYQQSADKLNLVNTVMLESTQAAYTSTVADIANRIATTQSILNTGTGELVAGVTSLNSAIRAGVQKMVNNGLTGFIDHGGHHWSPEAYVTMDMRTTLANTGRAAVFERMEDYGDDLYMVSWHDGARPLCYPWQGKIISKSNRTGETEDVDGNKHRVYAQSETSYGEPAGLFGINCGHYPMPWIPGYSVVREPQQTEEENAKEYQESQKQRALERKLRAEKRDLEVLKAQGADPEEIKAQRQRVKAASGELDDFCKDTGRARRRNREGVMSDAKWNTPSGEVRRFNNQYISTAEVPKVTPIKVNTPTQNTPAAQGSALAQKVQAAITPANPNVTSEIATKILPASGIQTVDLVKWQTTPTEAEIIKAVGGADQTSGSCASVALAYAGNKAGYQVHDYRGGASEDFFSKKANTAMIARISGIDGKIINSAKEIETANKLLATMEDGKQYWLGTGQHASIVRKTAKGYQYLELQSANDNGWHDLNDFTLRYRFGCVKKRIVATDHRLIDVDKLASNDEFIEILRYLNTPVADQRKGVGGGIK